MKWRIGKSGSTIVSDEPLPDVISQTAALDQMYYGGHLVAESVFSPQAAKLIAAAPELLQALQAVNAFFAMRTEELGSLSIEAQAIHKIVQQNIGKATK